MFGLLKRRTRPQYRPGSNLRPMSGVAVAERDGRAVLLDMSSERYFGLDEVGARLWSALAAGATAEEAARALADDYDAPIETLVSDAQDFAARLVDARLLEVI